PMPAKLNIAAAASPARPMRRRGLARSRVRGALRALDTSMICMCSICFRIRLHMQAPFPPSSSRARRGPEDVRESEPFIALARKARKRDELDKRLRQTLPSPLRDEVRLADLRRGCLVFLAPSPAWASRLRMAQGQLLAAARAMGT